VPRDESEAGDQTQAIANYLKYDIQTIWYETQMLFTSINSGG